MLLISVSLLPLSPNCRSPTLSPCRSCQSLSFPLPLFFLSLSLSLSPDQEFYGLKHWFKFGFRLDSCSTETPSLSLCYLITLFPSTCFSLHRIDPSPDRRLIWFVGWFKYGFRLDPGLTEAPLVSGFCLGHLASTISSIV